VTRIATPLEGTSYLVSPSLDPVDAVLEVESRLGIAPYAVPAGIDQVNWYTGFPPGRVVALGEALADLGPGMWVAFRRFSLTHVVVNRPVTPADVAVASAAVGGGRPIHQDLEHDFVVWAVPHRPWASFADQVLPAVSDAEALAAVVAAERRGDPAVVVQGAGSWPTSPGSVLSASRGPDRLRIEAVAGRDGLLVVNDTLLPGWTATLDGRPVPIVRADFLVRAVAWPAGRHVLEMRYHAPGLGAGLVLSAAGVLLLLAVAFASRRRNP
jgi:hypothetical protein